MVYCTNCGVENPEDANFCYSCGAPIAAAKEPRDSMGLEEEDSLTTMAVTPQGFFKCGDDQKFNDMIIRNIRAIIQLFNVKVFVYPERVEIRGTIPTQILKLSTDKQITTAPIILSPSPSQGEGELVL